MDEVDAGQTGSVPPPRSVGEILRAAREAQGLSVADIGARTRVPLRHLEAIETGDYASLPSPTYAVGFARAYARTVGVDEVATARAIRVEVDRIGRRQPEYEPYEVTDPSRVPSRGVAIVAAGLALGLLVLVALYVGGYFGGDWLRSVPTQPSVPDAAPVVATGPAVTPLSMGSEPAPTPSPSPTPVGPGEVVLTANDEIWLRVYDAGKTLKIGTMQPGERYVVPATATDPMINIGRADKLTVTLDGKAIPPLGTGERPIKDVRIGGAALAARLAGAPLPSAPATEDASAAPETVPRRTPRAAPQRPRRVLTETQRANLEAARTPPRPVATPR